MRFIRQRWMPIVLALVAIPLVGLIAIAADGLTDETPQSDVAIVLGNTVRPDGVPSPRLAARLDRCLELWRDGTVRAVIVSGGTGKEGVPEATAMARYLIERGIPSQQVILDNEGVDTDATAKNAADLMRAQGYQSAIVVSQWFHIPRAKLAMSKHGIKAGGAHPDWFEMRDTYSAIRELPAYLAYTLR